MDGMTQGLAVVLTPFLPQDMFAHIVLATRPAGYDLEQMLVAGCDTEQEAIRDAYPSAKWHAHHTDRASQFTKWLAWVGPEDGLVLVSYDLWAEVFAALWRSLPWTLEMIGHDPVRQTIVLARVA